MPVRSITRWGPARSTTRWSVGLVAPCVMLSIGVAGSPASAATHTTAFCSQSATLVKDLLSFGRLPKTNAAISTALTRVDRELASLGTVAPNRQDRATIATLRTEFAQLRKIILTDPYGAKPSDATFVRGFSRTAAKQGLALGAEIKAACSR